MSANAEATPRAGPPPAAESGGWPTTAFGKWAAVFTVMLGMMSAILASTMVNVAIPDVMGAFGAGQDEVHWLSTGFISAMTICMLLNAFFLGRLGPRNTYVLAVLVFAGASLIGQWATSLEMLIASRVMQGACAGLLQPLALTVIYPMFPVHDRARVMGIFGMGIVLGPAIGPTVGGLIVDHLSWPFVFSAGMPMILLAGALAMVTLPVRMPESRDRPFNWLSFILIVGIVFGFLISLSHGQRDGWTDPEIVLGFVGVAMAVALLVGWELSCDSPLLEPRLFLDRTFTLCTLTSVVFGASMFSSIYVAPLFARTVQQYDATTAGMLMMPAGLILVAVFPLAGRMTPHVAPRWPVLFGFASIGYATLWLSGADTNTSFWTMAMLLLCGRVGLGFVMPTLNLHGYRTLPPHLLPYGAGTMNFVRMFGGATGVNLASIVLDRRESYHLDYLAATQTPDNPETAEYLRQVLQRLHESGLSAWEQGPAAMGQLARAVLAQAHSAAHQDAFLFVAILAFLGMVPAIFLGGRLIPGEAPVRRR